MRQYYDVDKIKRFEKIIIFGCGDFGRKLYKAIKEKTKIVAVIDNDSKKWGNKFAGSLKVDSPEKIIRNNIDALFCIANLKYNSEICQQLLNAGISGENILRIENEALIERVLSKYTKYEFENKYFIYDRPQKRAAFSILSKSKYIYMDICNSIRMKFCNIMPIEKKYNVSICAIFKDEAPYLREWIEFHLLVGIDHFYLYNNFSSDDYMYILKPYIKEGKITLIDWPIPQGQLRAYQDCFEKFSHESKWIGMIDIDEFVVPIEYEKVYDFLCKFERSSGSVCIYWKNFGTSGIIKRNPHNSLVIEDFKVCWRKHMDIGKCFVNTMFSCDFSDINWVTHHEAWTVKDGHKYPPVNCCRHIALFQKYNKIRGKMPIQINHYLVKSYEEMKNKINKGDVYFKDINSYKEYYLMDYEKNNTTTDYAVYKYLINLKINMKIL